MDIAKACNDFLIPSPSFSAIKTGNGDCLVGIDVYKSSRLLLRMPTEAQFMATSTCVFPLLDLTGHPSTQSKEAGFLSK